MQILIISVLRYIYTHTTICIYIYILSFRSDLRLYIRQGGDDVADVQRGV